MSSASRKLAFHNSCGKLAALKTLWSQLVFRSRYPLAIVAGLLLAAAFPKIGIAGFAWVAPAFMLLAAHGKSGADAFRIGYVAGLAFYLAALYWLLLIPVTGYPILGWISLSMYLALYPAAWIWLVVGKVGEGGWTRRALWSLGGAAIWVALEMVVGRLFSGFPWLFVGNSQFCLLPLIQIASVTGVYGVSFLVVWMSLSLFSAARAILRQPTARYVWMSEVILPLGVLIAVFGFGVRQLAQPGETKPTLRVTFVQPSIPQTMIWNEADNDCRFVELLQLTRQALTNTTDLLVWPEAAVPNKIRYDQDTFDAVAGLARSNQVWMIIGSDDAEPPRNGSTNEADVEYFNSSFLISPQGELAARYCKRNLVIFGEYIPLVRWLPFVKWFTPITGGFTAGDSPVPFVLERRSPTRPEPSPTQERRPPARRDGVGVQASALPQDTLKRELQHAGSETGAPSDGGFRVKTSSLICFEDVFPNCVREYVEDNTDFLVNLTNDGWFGESAEQWQHAAAAIFRAVENGLPLLRCANNGLTCWVDANGRLRQIFSDRNGSVHGAGFMTADIPLLSPGEKRPPTFYHQHGDLFGWSCAGVATAVLLARLARRKTV